MQSVFVRGLADQSAPIEKAHRERKGKPLRLRVQPQILGKRQYRAWREVSWTLACDTPAAVFAVRDAMQVFFTALASRGPAAVTAAITRPEGKEDAA